MLKKEFKRDDVQRIRNLVLGKSQDKLKTGVGYNKPHQDRAEGEVWEEDNRKWTIKNGIKQNVTKLDLAKSLYKFPLFCPSCNSQMKKDLDEKYFRVHKKCFNCVINFETELRRLGVYEVYHNGILNNEVDEFIKEFKVYMLEYLKETNNSFVTENGDVEKWVGKVNKSRVLEDLDTTIKYLESLKK